MLQDLVIATRRLSIATTVVLVGSVVLILIIRVAIVSTSNAQPYQPVAISESSKTYAVRAGAVQESGLILTNQSNKEQQIVVYPRPFSANDDSSRLNFGSINQNNEVYQWLELEKTVFVVQPGSSVVVPYLLKVPATTKPGKHYGIIFAETETNAGASGESGRTRIGQVLSVSVGNDTQVAIQGELKGFSLPVWQNRPPLTSYGVVANTGATDFKVKTSTKVMTLLGQTKHIHTDTFIALPETVRSVGMNWKNAPNFGVYNVRQQIEFLGQRHQSDGYVFFAPRWLPVLLILGILTGGAYAAIHHRKK